MLVAALGGEGGGVLTNWLIEVAQSAGWHCQTTSLAGVAQRTGATIYYLEFMPREAEQPQPILSLFPAQGDIDIAVTSEIAEAGRMISRGFVSPDRTTLISSDHRVYGITEKSDTGDGAVDRALILELSDRYARRFIHSDMLELVQRHGTVISAGLLGAIAGAGVLPFEKAVFVDAIAAGRGAEANRAAFEESFQRAAPGGVTLYAPETAPSFVLPEPSTPLGSRLLPALAVLPAATHEVVYHGVVRLLDYQDEAYATEFIDRIADVAARDSGDDDFGLTRETARWLALWMAYEDIPRVAQLKCRPAREAEVRTEVGAQAGQAIQVTEFFHPRVEEVAALLPIGLGNRLLASEMARKILQYFLGPRKLRTDKFWTLWTMRCLASLRGRRRATLGFAHEWSMIERWFASIQAVESPAVARALADCGRMVKGYGATRHRTTTRLMRIIEEVETGRITDAASIWRLQAAAMAGDDQARFTEALAESQ